MEQTTRRTEVRESVVVRFAGDSGDGMQLTGTQFTLASVFAGNDVATFPDYPAEIRAPAGTLAGVSGFQLHFAADQIHTSGDAIDVLVAMNPAALASNIAGLLPNGVLIVNSDSFSGKGLRMAGYENNPLEDETLDDYQLFSVGLGRLTSTALVDHDLSAREVERCKNFFALGLMCWLYERPVDAVEEELATTFQHKPRYLDANLTVFKAGYNYGENSEQFRIRYQVPEVPTKAPGRYRNITGNEALSLGLVAAGERSGRTLFLGSYPITPASDILHHLAKRKEFGVKTFQAEDEIAAICASIGAAWGNALAITTTSGPGVALKGEAIGLAVMTELPLVIINVQRGGPSTGLPTKTEQSDLLQAMYGRNGESPVAIVAARSPGDAFWVAYEACRIAIRHMVPVMLLSDGSIANSAEPWKVPGMADLPAFESTALATSEHIEGEFQPYSRDPDTLARPWPVLGTPGLQHRLGGLEKWDGTGHISYDPDNHDHMTRQRQERVDRIADEIGPCELIGKPEGDVLVICWGSTWGACLTAVRQLQAEGKSVTLLPLRWLNPMPTDLGERIAAFSRVLVPEINSGQLLKLLRGRFDFDGRGYNRVAGQPLKVADVRQAILDRLSDGAGETS